MAIRIGVLGLSSNNNIGDYLLVESTRRLLEMHAPGPEYIDIDIDPMPKSAYPGVRRLNLKIFNRLRRYEARVLKLIPGQRARYLYQYFYWYVKLHWHLKAQIRGVDALVFSGGGFIKFQTQGLNYLDEQVIKLAQHFNIPVMMSAVGVEHFDEDDVRCRRLKKALNRPVVKTITTRDDLETLQNNYITSNHVTVDGVADPVLLLGSMLPPRPKTSDRLIGINLVNPDNFVAYGGNLPSSKVFDFYVGMLTELRAQGQDFRLFTNGMKVDFEFGRAIMEFMGLDASAILPRPETSAQFIADLQKFDIILAARMHAGITATALGIPVAGLIWSHKIELFATVAGIRTSYYAENEMDPMAIATVLAKRSVVAPNDKQIKALGQKTIDYLNSFIASV
jgi:polysaccharide pyruvyl transferase WcaK-like protein